jgi:trk system potassium uptake protein TrkA
MNQPKKQVCVIGLGHFGWQLATELATKCEVLAIDTSQETVDEIAPHVQRALCLDAREFSVLSRVVTQDFDEAVVGMGENMEASILCTLHLSKIGVKRICAKAVSDDHAEILRAVGATELIYPEQETAHRLAARIMNPNLLDFLPLSDDHVVMEVAAPPAFQGQTLAQLNLRGRFGTLVIAIRSAGQSRLEFLPGPGYVIRPEDRLVVIGRQANLLQMEVEGQLT